MMEHCIIEIVLPLERQTASSYIIVVAWKHSFLFVINCFSIFNEIVALAMVAVDNGWLHHRNCVTVRMTVTKTPSYDLIVIVWKHWFFSMVWKFFGNDHLSNGCCRWRMAASLKLCQLRNDKHHHIISLLLFESIHFYLSSIVLVFSIKLSH